VTWVQVKTLRHGCEIFATEDGVVRALGVGAYIKLELGEGTWNVDGDTLRFNLQISGFQRGDISVSKGFMNPCLITHFSPRLCEH
jgi:hypothetical protein